MRSPRGWAQIVAAVALTWGLVGTPTPVEGQGADGLPLTASNPIFRTMVLVRKGPALGSGVIIGSIEGETLILTAAHVVEDAGPLHIELGRYNFGWEQIRSPRGWPRRVPATIAAQDRDSDLAVLRVRDEARLPFVAPLGLSNAPVPVGSGVASLGFDHGGHLTGFPTRVLRVELVDLEKGGGSRPFLLTEHPPEVGRSGGGLFGDDGALVGICLARIEIEPGETRGLYSPLGNIRRLLATKPPLGAVVAGSRPTEGIRPTVRRESTTNPAPGELTRRTEMTPRAK